MARSDMPKTSITGWPPESVSSSFPGRTRSTALEVAWLVLLGSASVVAHGLLRGKLGLPPGHQGTVWIAMVVVGRLKSHLPWAGVTAGLGAAATSMLPFWGFGDPFRWLAYVLAGATIDLGFLAGRHWQRRFVFIVALGGIAHAIKPLLRVWITSTNGWLYESLLAGFTYPTWSHAFFGMVGAAAGALLVRSRLRRS